MAAGAGSTVDNAADMSSGRWLCEKVDNPSSTVARSALASGDVKAYRKRNDTGKQIAVQHLNNKPGRLAGATMPHAP